MIGFREILLMLAGFEVAHTLSHLFLAMCVDLPLKLKIPPLTVTNWLNTMAILFNAVVTAVLFWWALKL